jgi:hypothetical protein
MILASGALLGLAFSTCAVANTDGIDPEADKILKSMSTYLGGLSAFSAKADVDTEIIDLEGQKIQLSSSSNIVIERPGKLYARRQGVVVDAELIFDGKTLTLHGKDHNVYYQSEKPGTVDDVIDALRTGIGLDAPAADLMYADPYPGLVSGVTSGVYLGTAFVNGIECHHLTFRQAQVDWQLWVKVGDEPLPMKYIVTTKWLTGAPQYSARFRDWNTKPQIEAKQFVFTAPEGAKRLTEISVDEIGEPVMGEQK